MVALTIIGAVSCFVRIPSAHHDVVWAEDANIFLDENLRYGPWETLFRGYAGYQHLVPRLVSSLILATRPLDEYATTVFLVCSVIVGLIGAAVFWLSRDVIPWLPARVALAVIPFVIPATTPEIIGNMADIHSYFMWLAPWLFFYRARSWWSATAWGVVAFLTVMTEVQTILFLPLILMCWGRRNRYSWPIAGAFVIGAIWQVATILTVQRQSSAAWLGISSIVQGWLINTVMPLLIASTSAVKHQLQTTGLIIPLLIMIPFVLAFLAALIWGTGRQRILVITLALASAAIYAGGATVDGSWYFRYAEAEVPMWERILNVRYGASSGMMLAGVVPVAAAVLMAARFSRRWQRVTAQIVAWVGVIGLIVVLALASTRSESSRGWVEGQWSAAVQSAVISCAEQDPAAIIRLPVAPNRLVDVTCHEILSRQ